jgi:hypothetical protein
VERSDPVLRLFVCLRNLLEWSRTQSGIFHQYAGLSGSKKISQITSLSFLSVSHRLHVFLSHSCHFRNTGEMGLVTQRWNHSACQARGHENHTSQKAGKVAATPWPPPCSRRRAACFALAATRAGSSLASSCVPRPPILADTARASHGWPDRWVCSP